VLAAIASAVVIDVLTLLDLSRDRITTFGLSPTTIRVIEKKAIRRLRYASRSRRLRRYL